MTSPLSSTDLSTYFCPSLYLLYTFSQWQCPTDSSSLKIILSLFHHAHSVALNKGLKSSLLNKLLISLSASSPGTPYCCQNNPFTLHQCLSAAGSLPSQLRDQRLLSRESALPQPRDHSLSASLSEPVIRLISTYQQVEECLLSCALAAHANKALVHLALFQSLQPLFSLGGKFALPLNQEEAEICFSLN